MFFNLWDSVRYRPPASLADRAYPAGYRRPAPLPEWPWRRSQRLLAHCKPLGRCWESRNSPLKPVDDLSPRVLDTSFPAGYAYECRQRLPVITIRNKKDKHADLEHQQTYW